jgi:hypothetical protein
MLPSYLLHGTVVKKTMGQEGMSMGITMVPTHPRTGQSKQVLDEPWECILQHRSVTWNVHGPVLISIGTPNCTIELPMVHHLNILLTSTSQNNCLVIIVPWEDGWYDHGMANS